MVNKQRKKAEDTPKPSDSNIKKEQDKLDKYQGLKEEQERMWKVR